MVLVLAACLSGPLQPTTTLMAGSSANRSASLVSLISCETTVHRLSQQGHQLVLGILAGAAVLQVCCMGNPGFYNPRLDKGFMWQKGGG